MATATREPYNTPARILVLFALVGILLFGGVVWVGWRLSEMDRVLESERSRDRLENASRLICGEMDRVLSGWDQTLRRYSEGETIAAPEGAVLAAFDHAGIARHRGVPLLFQPTMAPDPPSDAFAAAEQLEFRQGDVKNAIILYRDLSRNPDRRIQAGTLMRLARCLRRQNNLRDALNAYAKLSDFGETQVAGLPAALLARHERITVFETLRDDRSRTNELAQLAAALQEGIYPIDRATYEFFREALSGTMALQEDPRQRALSEALASVWQRRQASPDTLPARWIVAAGSRSLLAVTCRTPEGFAAMVAGYDELMAAIEGSREMRVRVRLMDANGQGIWGDKPDDRTPQLLKTPLETGLPWSVRITSADSAAERSFSLARRRLLVGAIALITLALAAAGYAIFRAVAREIRVARLQSDFVAAVSHEFRTPLAAMCHLTESLEDDRVADERRPAYYRALARESRRLKEMVESLLDFARMESGRDVYRKEQLVLTDLVRRVVTSFREQNGGDNRRIDLTLPEAEIHLPGDGEALARAIRNLLDNAAKYSPVSAPIGVSLSTESDQVLITVEDQGAGILREEQRDIFRKFVRGSASRSLNVKGTGIGLAMVQHIVAGHGGIVEVVSEPGRGSRFTICLPGESASAKQDSYAGGPPALPGQEGS